MLRFYTINALALVVFFGLLLAGFFGDVPAWLYILFVLIWILITAIGSFQIKWNYHLQSLNHNFKTSENHISITFDDGPNPIYTPKVLSLLKENNAKATFFLIGKKAEKQPDLVRQILSEGHAIGNHSYSHSKNFGFFSSENVAAELKRTNSILKEITGKELKLFRPPFGVTNPNIKKALKTTGHLSIGWSKRSFDTTSLSEKRIVKRITSNLKKGDIILLHDSSAKTVAVLEQLLLTLQPQKLQSVPVDRLLEIEAYA
ncbi:MAG TPA: polysaccharide deacetylase family protein [Aequorivita sp.]|mgnify:FL=1|jgi:peptidoglycan/xylan/chitin deacetylase (PgdA/CDA1 family)|nr:polysaccharide deacetylase [Aequorivita sp.]MBP40773.1 polysaccharide deacetylase [Aequorivita sp.]HNP68449.1 polysaccharide deacetylase family protein [Aequorivita sp.]|tara:strand:- start:21439 stop:22215 length:777 start_codon:yes stop_codon:yes gene_type:complete